MTIVPDGEGSIATARKVIEASHANYAKKYVSKKGKKPTRTDGDNAGTDKPKKQESESDDLPEMDAPLAE